MKKNLLAVVFFAGRIRLLGRNPILLPITRQQA
jgi:hypothetical protein